MPHMRAKLMVIGSAQFKDDTGAVQSENVKMMPVCSRPFGPEGESEDNTYARWTPSGDLSLSITNPALFGTFPYGRKFYVDFIDAPDTPAAEQG